MGSMAVRKHSLENPCHLLRYMKYQALSGTEQERVDALAKSERVSVRTIRDSITKIAAYRERTSQPEMEFAIRDLIISAIPQAKTTLNGLLDATELVEIKDEKTGKQKVIKQEDKTTRLEALKVVGTLITSATPKQPLVNVNQNNSNKAAVVAQISTAETTEERLRRLRKQAEEHNQLPPEVVGVPDYIDQDVEPEMTGEDDVEEEDEGEEDE